jgi:hypothetical protein
MVSHHSTSRGPLISTAFQCDSKEIASYERVAPMAQTSALDSPAVHHWAGDVPSLSFLDYYRR